MRNIRSISLAAAIVAALALPACGASTPRAEHASAEQPADLEWSRALLRKLAPSLREAVRSGEDDRRLAVMVFFQGRVRDAELSELLLSRVGDHYVGNVQPEVLHRIASRDDVDRIEPVHDLGY